MEIAYSSSLIILSVLVAILSSYVALNLAYSVTQAKGRARAVWLGCGSLAMGVGIWSMHFVGTLAFEMPGMDMAYDIPLMSLSVIVAIAGSALALFIVSRPTLQRSSLILGSIAMAAAISGMHYIGMYSMRMSARLEWNYFYVFLSVLIALVASLAALAISFRLRNKPDRFFTLLSASTLMGVAIAGMHYMGMIAATFVHDSSIQIEEASLMVSSGLTLATLSTSLLVLGIALSSSIAQRLIAIRQRRNEEILEDSEEKYRLLVQAVKDYAIFMLDPKGFISTWNSGAGHITGYTAAEVIGKHVSILHVEEQADHDIAEMELSTSRKTGHFEDEALRKKKDGSVFWANIVIDPLFDKKGRLTGYSKVIRDITDLKQANEDLERRVQERTLAVQERETQLRTITNAIPILVAHVDRNERFLFANNAFCEWFHRSQKEIGQFTFKDLLGREIYPANKIYIDRALKGETVTYERYSQRGARHIMLSITFVPEFDREKQVKGFFIVATDVSNYKRIEAELKSAKEQAEVANETKSAFLANMSHEIRTPLGAVLGFSELMLDSEVTASERVNYIEIIKRNGKLLSDIINDILDLSKVEAGKLEVERQPVVLNDLVKETSVLLNLEATGKGVHFTVSTEGVVPKTLQTDSTRLRQILFNIVGNAIKFTEKGTVSLKIKLSPKDASKLAFIVQDTGTGISAEQASRLFSPFTQADVTTTRKFGGTGLGLVLSKKLANALGGDVLLVESELGKGSTFAITIDHGQSQEVFFESSSVSSSSATVMDLSPHGRQSELKPLKILIVDDSADNLALITHILRLCGATVETANNGKEGVQKALRGDFSVILMDLQMPQMDGYEATKELRKNGFDRPIIALTAHAMKEERKRCLDNGFNDHLTKPVDRDRLLQTLSSYVG